MKTEQQIKRDCPQFFTLNGEDFKMVYYSKLANHHKNRSNEIIWSGSNGTEIHYYKGDLDIQEVKQQ